MQMSISKNAKTKRKRIYSKLKESINFNAFFTF